MKHCFLLLISVCWFLNCNYSGDCSGPSSDDLLYSMGGDDFIRAYHDYAASKGVFTNLKVVNRMGTNQLRAAVSNFDLTKVGVEKRSAHLLCDNRSLLIIRPSNRDSDFQHDHDQWLSDRFDGKQHTVRWQTDAGENTSDQNLSFPRQLIVSHPADTLKNTFFPNLDANTTLQWNADPDNPWIYIEIRADGASTSRLGRYNLAKGLRSSYYRSIKTEDDGAYLLEAKDLKAIPDGVRLSLTISRSNFTLANDLIDTSYKHLVLASSLAKSRFTYCSRQ